MSPDIPLSSFIGAAPGLTGGLSDDEFTDAMKGLPPDPLEAVQAALPEGWDLMVGYTSECRDCSGWWATASKRLEEPPYYPQIVTSEAGRPRGDHHDRTPSAALRALAARLRER